MKFMMPNTDRLLYFSECMFCNENYAHLFRLLFGNFNLNHLIIYKTPNFVVLPDIAPLVEGHLLIISLTHFLCFGNLPDDHFKEFEEIKDYITQLLTKTYTRHIFFEHGPALPKRAGCCIDHAHIHCVPAETDLSSTISNKLIKEKISSILDLCDFSKRNISYLFYETSPSKIVRSAGYIWNGLGN
jgi:ATP adenylyltransferase